MRYFAISDERDTLTGLRLAGIEGVIAQTPKQVEERINMVCADESIAVLLITESCAAQCRELIDQLKLSARRPLVAVIPGTAGTAREPDSITRLIREAIGIKI